MNMKLGRLFLATGFAGAAAALWSPRAASQDKFIDIQIKNSNEVIELPVDSKGTAENAIVLESHINPACGQAAKDTPCDQGCIKLGPANVKAAPACARYCTDIPQGKEVWRVTLQARNLDQNKWSPCGAIGAPGDCEIGWTRFEGAQHYAERRRFCVGVKNWSHNLQRGYRISIELRDKK